MGCLGIYKNKNVKLPDIKLINEAIIQTQYECVKCKRVFNKINNANQHFWCLSDNDYYYINKMKTLEE